MSRTKKAAQQPGPVRPNSRGTTTSALIFYARLNRRGEEISPVERCEAGTPVTIVWKRQRGDRVLLQTDQRHVTFAWKYQFKEESHDHAQTPEHTA